MKRVCDAHQDLRLKCRKKKAPQELTVANKQARLEQSISSGSLTRNFFSCCPFEFAERQSLCSVISREKKMQLACCIQDQPSANCWWFRWQCPVLLRRSCTSWNQGLRSTVTITRIQFCWICFFFLLLERISLAYHIRSIFGDYYVFQQDGAPAHRPRDTVTMLQRDARV